MNIRYFAPLANVCLFDCENGTKAWQGKLAFLGIIACIIIGKELSKPDVNEAGPEASEVNHCRILVPLSYFTA
jgi:hypothetical protein